MQIQLARNGQVIGQHEADAIPALLQAGTVLPTDHYWHEGMTDWAIFQTKWPPATPAAPAAEPPVAAVATTTTHDLAAIVDASPAIKSGARWFWWIAGLSLVNTILSHTGSDFGFVIGLGFTLIADALFHELKIVAFVIDFIAIGFFFGIGWFATKGRFWAFVVGFIAYACDLLICLIGQDWMLIAFHALALFFIFRGARELRAAVKEAKQAPQTA